MVKLPPKKLNFALVTSAQTTQYHNVCAISSINEKGPFDVLPGHANFISIINTVVTVHEGTGNRRDIAIETGVMHVSGDTVRVYIGFGEEVQGNAHAL